MLDVASALRYSASMPTIDVTCQHCGHSFKRIVLRGEAIQAVVCPACDSEDAKSAPGPNSLFDGIAPFSSLGADTN